MGWVGTCQIGSLQPDLKVQTVWKNVWGVVQLVFLPGGKVMTVHKPGELHVYDSINAKNTVSKARMGFCRSVRWVGRSAIRLLTPSCSPLVVGCELVWQDYKLLLNITDKVYSWWDHGLLSAALHPQFPDKPYMYIAVSHHQEAITDRHHTSSRSPLQHVGWRRRCLGGDASHAQ